MSDFQLHDPTFEARLMSTETLTVMKSHNEEPRIDLLPQVEEHLTQVFPPEILPGLLLVRPNARNAYREHLERETTALADERVLVHLNLQRFNARADLRAMVDQLRGEAEVVSPLLRCLQARAAQQLLARPEYETWKQLDGQLDALDAQLFRARQREEWLDHLNGAAEPSTPPTGGGVPVAAAAGSHKAWVEGRVEQDSGRPLGPTFACHSAPTYWARVSMGLQEGSDNPFNTVDEVRKFVQAQVVGKPFRLAVNATELLHPAGSEPGVEVVLTNFPGDPVAPDQLRADALYLAKLLLLAFGQIRLTVMFPNETVSVEHLTHSGNKP